MENPEYNGAYVLDCLLHHLWVDGGRVGQLPGRCPADKAEIHESILCSLPGTVAVRGVFGVVEALPYLPQPSIMAGLGGYVVLHRIWFVVLAVPCPWLAGRLDVDLDGVFWGCVCD